MKPFEGWTIISDLDNTLFWNATRCIPEENQNAIAYWRENGGRFTIATGRYLGSTLPLVRELGLDAPFIYNNGASIYDPARDVFDAVKVFGESILPVISDILQRVPYCGVAGYDKEHLYLVRPNPSMERHLKRQNITPKPVTDDAAVAGFCKFLLTVEASEMETLKSELAQTPYFNNFHFTQSTAEFYEITRIGATKGGQIQNLCRLLGTPAARVIAVGDNENDLTMLQAAPYSFAVANATPVAKEAAGFVTETQGDTGAAIAEVIERMAEKILTEANHGTI